MTKKSIVAAAVCGLEPFIWTIIDLYSTHLVPDCQKNLFPHYFLELGRVQSTIFEVHIAVLMLFGFSLQCTSHKSAKFRPFHQNCAEFAGFATTQRHMILEMKHLDQNVRDGMDSLGWTLTLLFTRWRTTFHQNQPDFATWNPEVPNRSVWLFAVGINARQDALTNCSSLVFSRQLKKGQTALMLPRTIRCFLERGVISNWLGPRFKVLHLPKVSWCWAVKDFVCEAF